MIWLYTLTHLHAHTHAHARTHANTHTHTHTLAPTHTDSIYTQGKCLYCIYPHPCSVFLLLTCAVVIHCDLTPYCGWGLCSDWVVLKVNRLQAAGHLWLAQSQWWAPDWIALRLLLMAFINRRVGVDSCLSVDLLHVRMVPVHMSTCVAKANF